MPREVSRVFFGNLSQDCREKDVERFFEKYGRVRNVFIKNGRYGFCVSILYSKAPLSGFPGDRFWTSDHASLDFFIKGSQARYTLSIF